ncbi:recQ-mediated genome instability protein 1 [Punica granatum]|nr:recQ-mediated genome instability protein 1 [Punica granatum]OWM65508.1 hypothetical protein CDL15_Pgr009098 [Punica granatum]
MGRRRLRLNCSDDEADDGQQPNSRPPPQLHQQTLPQTAAVVHPHSHSSPAIDISDEEAGDFIDVSEDLSPPSPPVSSSIPGPMPPTPVVSLSSGSAAAFDCPVSEYLGRMGLTLRREWLYDCLNRLEESVRGFPGLDVTTKAKLCLEQFLLSDMNYSGGGVLPANVEALHLVHLPGPFVLQVDEIVNISCPLRGRYQNASAGLKRCLKLSMTDGVQRVFGMEYRPIKDLETLASAGLKVLLCNVHVHHGLLMLVPEAVEVLGGVVSELEAARERLVNEVNKPPRGRRTRSGVLPALATRATRAAWTPNSVVSGDHSKEVATNSHAGGTAITLLPTSVPNNKRSSVESTSNLSALNAVSGPSSNFISDFEEMHVDADFTSTRNPVLNPPTNMEEMHMDSFPARSVNAVANSLLNNVSAVGGMNPGSEIINRETMVPDLSLEGFSGQEVIQIIDEVEHPKILRGNREIPFTYLASLSAKWAAMREKASSIEGKVKCFLTGVKGFQYKQRMSYELRVYVDDGSLISEILIDPDVVQNGIGRTPEEVTAALSSLDKNVVSGMKETLKQFQSFLANFEGIMLIELNETSPVPIARQMTEGCNSSNAWLLLERLSSQSEAPRSSSLRPIELSP